MKKITLSLFTAVAMSTTAYAQAAETPYYLGLAYSDFDASYGSTDVTGDGMSALGGYTVDNNFAIELRYDGTLGDLDIGGVTRDKTITNVALYIKAMYPLNNFNVYGLFGVGHTSANNDSDNDFQYGVGAGYNLNDNFGLFADWTRLYDGTGLNYPGDSSDYSIDTWNIGVTYNIK